MNRTKQVIYELSREEMIKAVKNYMKKNKIKLSKQCKIDLHFDRHDNEFFGESSESTLHGAKITCGTKKTKIKGVGTKIKETTLEVDAKLLKKAILKYMKQLGYNVKKAEIELLDNLYNPAVRITVSK